MAHEVSMRRLLALRGMYLVNLAILAIGIWPELAGLHRAQAPLSAFTFCFWSALAALSGLGLRYPLAMLPVLMLQLLYKLTWLAAFWLPMEIAGPAQDLSLGGMDLFVMSVTGAAADIAVIPWRYVVGRFVRQPGDRWRADDGRDTEGPPLTVAPARGYGH